VRLFIKANGLSRWSPSQVLASICRIAVCTCDVCECACVRAYNYVLVFALLSGIRCSGPGNKCNCVTTNLLVFTAGNTGHNIEY